MINGSIFNLPLADQSVHCIVFSPPYYGLRDYGLDPIIIGGELDCEHEWGSEQLAGEGYSSGERKRWQHKQNRSDSPDNWQKQTSQGSFCLNCSAWRGSLGLEPTPELFIEHCRIYARECWRVLRDDGMMWVNIGASYAGGGTHHGNKNQGMSKSQQRQRGEWTNNPSGHYKPKDLIPTPWLFAIALQQDGWYLRSDCIWQKPNPMPESVTDRPTRSHEYVFLFSKSRQYFYDADAVREPHKDPSRSGKHESNNAHVHRPDDLLKQQAAFTVKTRQYNPAGRNLRSVWTIPTYGFSEAHFATFPPKLIEPMIKAGTSERGVCIECGSQFERVVDKSLVHLRNIVGYGIRDELGHTTNDQSSNRKRDGHQPGVNKNHTLGFRPTCKHYDPLYYTHFPMARKKRKRYQQFKSGHWWKRVKKRPVPISWPTDKAIVLDPFGGAGTTELVSTSLGRQGISIELSLDYCKMAVERLKSKGKRMPLKLVKLIKQGQRQMFNKHKIEVKGDELETLDQMRVEQLDMFKADK